MLAIEDSASIFCAREMRGTLSIASTVALRAASCCISSGFCAGQMKLTSVVALAHAAATSAALGARTLKTMSALAQMLRRADDLGAGRAVGVVGEVRRVARARFDGDAEAELDQLLDDLGNGGDALLARRGLARHSDQL